MIYFGQEFGERGMDTEGFSGRDGRTTIFDYWSINTIRQWRNGGKFDGKMMSEEAKALHAFYNRLLNLCNEEKAISEGKFFDLMYANLNGWKFNEHKQFAFMRQYEQELLLIVVNFDEIAVNIAINIPWHPSRGEFFLHQRRTSFSSSLHPHLDRASRVSRQGGLHSLRHRHQGTSPVRRYGSRTC